MKNTPLQEFIEQIRLKQVEGSVYLLPTICDFQIEEALKREREEIEKAYRMGKLENVSELPKQSASEYFTKNFKQQQ